MFIVVMAELLARRHFERKRDSNGRDGRATGSLEGAQSGIAKPNCRRISVYEINPEISGDPPFAGNFAICYTICIDLKTAFRTEQLRMVAILIFRFRAIQRRLTDEIENYDSAEFQQLDEQIVETFEAIDAFVPQTAADSRLLITFYLDMIAANDGGDNQRLIDRVQVLLSQLPDYPPADEDVSGGGGI